MDETLYRKVVAAVPLLRTLDMDELTEVIAISRLIKVKAGATVVREGEPGTAVYFVVHGNVAVLKKLPRGKSKKLSELGPGEVFGEMALIDNSPRSATIETLTECVLYEMDLDAFGKLRAQFKPSAFKILRQLAPLLCKRLRMLHDVTNDMMKQNSPANIQDAAERLLSK